MAAIIFSSAFIYKAKAQTADSAFTITDTSVTTINNMIVTDSSGHTTLFAGGQQSNFNGKVGVGTASPSSKLAIYDAITASFRISQPFKKDTTHHNNFRGTHNSLIGNDGQPISNFDINILNDNTADNIFRSGSVILRTSNDVNDPEQVQGVNFNATSSISGAIAAATPQLEAQGCGAQYMPPSMVFNSRDFGWYGFTCPSGNPSILNMYLDPVGNLTTTGGATFNGNTSVTGGDFVVYDNSGKANPLLKLNQADQTLTLNGEFIINNPTTSNKIFEVHQADNYVYARDIHVTQNNFPDYVFAHDYKLMGLSELETYINAHHHLPEMPTAKEVAQNDLSVSETTALLTKKIEELTLYMIELKKENEAIKAELKSIKK